MVTVGDLDALDAPPTPAPAVPPPAAPAPVTVAALDALDAVSVPITAAEAGASPTELAAPAPPERVPSLTGPVPPPSLVAPPQRTAIVPSQADIMRTPPAAPGPGISPADAAFARAGLIPPSKMAEAIRPKTPEEVVPHVVAAAPMQPASPPPQFLTDVESPTSPRGAAQTHFQESTQRGLNDLSEGLVKFLTVQPVPEGKSPLKHKMLAGQQFVSGIFALGLAPFMALGAGARQGLRNLNPALEATPALDPNFSAFVREMMGGSPPERTSEVMAALRQPMTVGEVLELGTTLIPPALLHGIAPERPVAPRPERVPELPATEAPVPAPPVPPTPPAVPAEATLRPALETAARVESLLGAARERVQALEQRVRTLEREVRGEPTPAPAEPVTVADLDRAGLAAPPPVSSEAHLRATVEAGGGVWTGIQEVGGKPEYAVFNEPAYGSTLYLPIEGLTPEAVRGAVEAKRQEYEAARPPAAVAPPVPPRPARAGSAEADVTQILSDPAQLVRFVRLRGGLAPSSSGDLAGEYAAIPLYVKNRRGLSPDLMAQALSEAMGRPVSDAELLDALAHKGRLAAVERARPAVEEAAATREADRLQEERDLAALSPEEKARRVQAMTGVSAEDALSMVQAADRARAAIEAQGEPAPTFDVSEARRPQRFVVSNEGMMRGMWKIVDTTSGETERTVGSRAVAQDIADGLNRTGPEGISGATAHPVAPASGIRWQHARTRDLAAFTSEDGRFRVDQVAPDVWRIQDNQDRAVQARFPTFHEARRWADAQVAAAPTGVPSEALARRGGLSISLRGKTYPVESLADASRRFRATIETAGTGGTDTPTPFILDESGEPIGYLSYNGRIWAGRPQDWKPGDVPIYDPRVQGEGRTPPAVAPRYERTALGEQAIVPGTPARTTPTTPLRSAVPQRPVQETPLFRQREQGEQPDLPGVSESARPRRREQIDTDLTANEYELADARRERGNLFNRTPRAELQQRIDDLQLERRRLLRERIEADRSVGEPDISQAERPLAPTFYSTAQKVIDEKMANRAPAQIVANLLHNNGVKADEMKWTGLDDYLRERGTQPVTKPEVQDFLRQNEVRVEEVVKGGASILTPEDRSELDALEAKLARGAVSPSEQQRYNELYDRLNASTAAGTKFSRFTLPGGQNYRELLLTLPGRLSAGDERFVLDVEDRLASRPGDPHVRPITEAERERYNGLMRSYNATYRSGHWDEPNVLAHVRFNERTDAEGKRVLFLEELQSDWHQAGRRKGYELSAQERAHATARAREIDAILEPIIDDQIRRQNQGEVVKGDPTTLALEDEAFELRRRLKDTGVVPLAPFAKTWHELALKRMLRWAAEHGYDKVAWTPGSAQAERYDLSKQVSSVGYKVESDGQYQIFANPIGGGRTESLGIFPKEKLADVVGKDLADKIIAGGGEQMGTIGERRWFTGLDLKVGGEGMRGFYDKILPDFLNKYAKKWGARVGETELPGFGEPISKLRNQVAPESIAGRPFVTVGEDGRVMGQYQTFAGASTALDAREGYYLADLREGAERAGHGPVVNSIDITPAMKRSVLEEGQPSFAGAGDRLRGPAKKTAAEDYAPLAAGRGLPIEGTAARLVDTSGIVPQDHLAALQREPYVRALAQHFSDHVAELNGVLRGLPGYDAPDFIGFDTNFYDYGVNVHAPSVPGAERNMVILHPWTIAQLVQDQAARLRLDAGATRYLLAEEMHKTLLHELAHQIDRTHEAGFDRARDAILARVGQVRRILAVNRLEALLGDNRDGHLQNLFADSRDLERTSPEPGGDSLLRGSRRDAEGGVVATPGTADLAANPPAGRTGGSRPGEALPARDQRAVPGPAAELGGREAVSEARREEREVPFELQARGARQTFTPAGAERLAMELRGQGKDVEVRPAPGSAALRQVFAREPLPARAEGEGAPPVPPPRPPTAEGAAPIPEPPEGRAHYTPDPDITAMNQRYKPELDTDTLADRARRVREALKDKFIVQQKNDLWYVHEVDDALRRVGIVPRKGDSPLQRVEMARSRTSGQSEAFSREYQAILDRLGKAGLGDAFRDYLTYRQGEKRIRDLLARQERGGEPTPVLPGMPAEPRITPEGRTTDGGFVNPAGLDLPTIDAKLAEMRRQLTAGQFANLERAASETWALLRRNSLDLAQKSGLISDQLYASLVRRGEDYVPFQVLDYLADADLARAGGRAGGLKQRGPDLIKRMEGTERDVRDVRESIIDKALRSIAASERNLAKQAVTERARDLPELIRPVSGDTWQVPGGDVVITVAENGQWKNYAVPPTVARSLSFLDGQQSSFLDRVLRAFKTPLQAGATSMNPGFALVTNPLRDLWRKGIYSDNGGWRTGLNYVRALYHTVKKDEVFLDALRQGALTTFQRSITPEIFVREGIGGGGRELARRVASFPIDVIRGDRKVLSLPRDILKWAMEDLGKLANISEETTKLSDYLTGLKRTGRPAEAAYETLHYGGSPNFGKMGSVEREFSNLLFVFYNARLEGSVANIRRLREQPGRTVMRIGVAVALPTVAVYAWNSQYEDDEKNGVKGTPSAFDQQNYWNIKLPYTYQHSDGSIRRGYLRIPKEETAQAISGFIDNGLEYLRRRAPQAFAELVGNALGNISPINVDIKGQGTENVIASTARGVGAAMNPVLRIPLELGTNENLRFGGKIVPRAISEHLLPEDQLRPTTSPTMIALAKRIGHLYGVSPIQLEYVLTSGTGGLGQTVLDELDTLRGKALPETVGPYERLARQPIFSRIMGRAGDDRTRTLEDRFYQDLQRSIQAVGSLKAAAQGQGAESPRVAELLRDAETRRLIYENKALVTLGARLAEIRKTALIVTYQAGVTLPDRLAHLRALSQGQDQVIDAYERLSKARFEAPALVTR